MAIANTAVRNLVNDLTLDEKIQLVHGAVDPEGTATGYLPGVERLGIPELRLADGPLGVRAKGIPATSFPASIALAASFDPELANEQGRIMGREAKARNQDVVLGPGLNLIRVPHCGRNFEYYSEDPVLTAAFASAYVEGLQSEDVIATPKHYIANNQEKYRASIDVDVSQRALRECYLPGFKAAVDAGAGSIMTAYNSVNGSFMSENKPLLTDILKEEWGFEGFTMSDWFGTVSTVGSANAGLDLEMPGITREELWEAFGIDIDDEEDVFGAGSDVSDGMPDPTNTYKFAEPLKVAIESGEVTEDRLDDMVGRILRQMNRVGLLDGTQTESNSDESDHAAVSQKIAARGTVLLKNDNILPIDEDVDIAVLGPGVRETTTGGGSSEMEALKEVSTADGLQSRASGDVGVARGVSKVEQVSFFGGDEEDTDDAEPEPQLDAAVDAAATADVAIVVVQDTATEAKDRESLRLPGEQDALVEAVADANDNTVVVVQSSGPVEMPWRDSVSGILESWYPGQSDGDALAAVLYGDIDPSGRLPVTFAEESAYPLESKEMYPGRDDSVSYAEDLFVGYRHFDAVTDDPIFPFGHGLSYADFEYHSAEVIDDRTVRITVENTSNRDGREVIQAYVHSSEGHGDERPIRELGGFESVHISAGESVTVDISLDDLAFTKYGEAEGWTSLESPYTVDIARSANDTQLEVTL